MFFVLSHILGWMLQPLRLALALLALALVLRWVARAPRLRRVLVVVALAQLVLFSTRGAAELLLAPLESRHQRPAVAPSSVGAIAVLSGIARQARHGQGYELTEAADRIVEGLRLARRYPRAKLLVTGGGAAPFASRRPEADVLGALVRDLGLPRERLLLERRARTTRENALYSAPLLRGLDGPLLLVTSALHMPRALACFRKLGLNPVPWPVDFRRRGIGWRALFPGRGDLDASTDALHEYAGLLGYWIAGYIDAAGLDSALSASNSGELP